MQKFFVKLLTAIRLTRLTMAFGAVSDIWFVILLTRVSGDYPGVEDSLGGPQWGKRVAGCNARQYGLP